MSIDALPGDLENKRLGIFYASIGLRCETVSVSGESVESALYATLELSSIGRAEMSELNGAHGIVGLEPRGGWRKARQVCRAIALWAVWHVAKDQVFACAHGESPVSAKKPISSK